MSYDDKIDDQRITNRMREEVESLVSTAEMIDVLSHILYREVATMKRLDEEKSRFGTLGEWHEILTLLSLTIQQAEIVKNVGESFSRMRMAA